MTVPAQDQRPSVILLNKHGLTPEDITKYQGERLTTMDRINTALIESKELMAKEPSDELKVAIEEDEQHLSSYIEDMDGILAAVADKKAKAKQEPVPNPDPNPNPNPNPGPEPNGDEPKEGSGWGWVIGIAVLALTFGAIKLRNR